MAYEAHRGTITVYGPPKVSYKIWARCARALPCAWPPKFWPLQYWRSKYESFQNLTKFGTQVYMHHGRLHVRFERAHVAGAPTPNDFISGKIRAKLSCPALARPLREGAQTSYKIHYTIHMYLCAKFGKILRHLIFDLQYCRGQNFGGQAHGSARALRAQILYETLGGPYTVVVPR